MMAKLKTRPTTAFRNGNLKIGCGFWHGRFFVTAASFEAADAAYVNPYETRACIFAHMADATHRLRI